MARAKRQKPSDPEAARLARRVRELTDVGLQPEAAVLAAHSEVEVTRIAEERPGQNGKKVAHTVARRMDAFEALKAGMVDGAYDAARRLERDIMERRGEADRGRSVAGRVDQDPDYSRALRIAAAGQRVDAVAARLSPRDLWLLCELIAPSKDYDGWTPKWINEAGEEETGAEFNGWRAVVGYITGEINRDAQGARVRSACENLKDAYDEIERNEVRAA